MELPKKKAKNTKKKLIVKLFDTGYTIDDWSIKFPLEAVEAKETETISNVYENHLYF